MKRWSQSGIFSYKYGTNASGKSRKSGCFQVQYRKREKGGRESGRGRKKEGRVNNIRMTGKDFADGVPYFFIRSQALFSICHDKRTFRPLRFTSLIVCSKMDITNYFFKKMSTFFVLFKMLSYLIIISIKSEIFILG